MEGRGGPVGMEGGWGGVTHRLGWTDMGARLSTTSLQTEPSHCGLANAERGMLIHRGRAE